MIDTTFRVDPEHFEYLRLQKGSLDAYADNFGDWCRRYQEDIERTYLDIARSLPETCAEILDVGSGLGGIDVLLSRHYAARGAPPGVTLLDGIDDKPRMFLHRQTFSNARIARNFHWKNGTSLNKLATVGPGIERFDQPFDLIVSFGSWCFHYPPAEYLPRILESGIHPGTVLILDVRAGRREWLAALERRFYAHEAVVIKPKWSRIVFKVRP